MKNLLVSNKSNIRYLTNFTGSGFMLITPKQQYLFTDSRYIEGARSMIKKNIQLVDITRIWKNKEELQKIQDRDFTHNWVSSSAFLFYLQVACIVAFVLGGCYMLYNKRFDKPEPRVQEGSLYTPKYK